MTERRVCHLPVAEDNQPAGIVSIGGVVRAVVDEHQFAIATLERFLATANSDWSRGAVARSMAAHSLRQVGSDYRDPTKRWSPAMVAARLGATLAATSGRQPIAVFATYSMTLEV